MMNDNIDKEDIKSVVEFLLGDSIPKLTNGPKVVEFENSWGKWLGTKYNLFVNSGASANELTMLALAQKIKEYVPNLVIIEEQFKEDFDKRNYVVSNEKLEKTGWFCDYSLDAGTQELLSAYKMINNFKNKDFTNL
jgi:hypothetical protein